MAKRRTIRIAVGHPTTPFSGVWRFIIRDDDVYVGAMKASMGTFKISLHKSGVWVLSATEQSKVVFENGNRRAKKWARPQADTNGVTRGPSIVVPHTSLGARRRSLTEGMDGVNSVPPSAEGQAVELTLFFVEPGGSASWDDDQVVIDEGVLKSGTRVMLVVRTRTMPAPVAADVERFLRRGSLRTKGRSDDVAAQLRWFRESGDCLRTPFIFDLPVPILVEEGGV